MGRDSSPAHSHRPTPHCHHRGRTGRPGRRRHRRARSAGVDRRGVAPAAPRRDFGRDHNPRRAAPPCPRPGGPSPPHCRRHPQRLRARPGAGTAAIHRIGGSAGIRRAALTSYQRRFLHRMCDRLDTLADETTPWEAIAGSRTVRPSLTMCPTARPEPRPGPIVVLPHALPSNQKGISGGTQRRSQLTRFRCVRPRPD